MRNPFHLFLVVILTLGLWLSGVVLVSAQTVDLTCRTDNTQSLLERELAVVAGIDLTIGVTTAVDGGAGLAEPVPESSFMMPMAEQCTAVDGLITTGLRPLASLSDSDIYLLSNVPTTTFQLMLHHHPAATFRLLVVDAITGAFITNCSSLDQCLVQTTSSSVSISVSAIDPGVYSLSVYNGSALPMPAPLAAAGCLEQFGSAAEFVLCEQTATVCGFSTSPAPGETDLTCAARCAGAAPRSTCLGAYETSVGSCSPIQADDCTTPGLAKICFCER